MYADNLGAAARIPAIVSAPPPDLLAFHIGIVVHDLDAVADRYRRMLGVDRWRSHELHVAKSPFNERFTEAVVRIAYGRGAGQTIELIQVLEGRTQHSEFLEAHGEGVQHIGFWSADVRASVEAALAEGAKLVTAYIDAESNAVVQLTPGSPVAPVEAIDRGRIAYVDPGLATVQFEFCGPSAAPGLRGWLEEDFELLVTPPPWEV